MNTAEQYEMAENLLKGFRAENWSNELMELTTCCRMTTLTIDGEVVPGVEVFIDLKDKRTRLEYPYSIKLKDALIDFLDRLTGVVMEYQLSLEIRAIELGKNAN